MRCPVRYRATKRRMLIIDSILLFVVRTANIAPTPR